jgi:hypothetical protein
VTLFEIANMLDTDGKYLEADVVLDSMIRLATGRRTWRGNPNARPRTRFNPMPGARSVPQAPVAPQAPAAPQIRPDGTPVNAVNPIPVPQATPRDFSRNIMKLALKEGWDFQKLNSHLDKFYPDRKDDFIEYFNEKVGPNKYQEQLSRINQQRARPAPASVPKPTPTSAPKPTPASSPKPVPSAPQIGRSNPEFAKKILSKLLAKGMSIDQIDNFLDGTPLSKQDVIAQYNAQFGENAYQTKLNASAGAGSAASSASSASSADTPIMAQLKKALNTKIGQKLLSAIKAAYDKFMSAFNLIKSKIPPAALKVLGKIKFVFIFLNFVRFFNSLINGTLTYKETIEFIAACAAISKEVLAYVGAIPFIGPGLVAAVIAVNFGAADIVQFFGDPESGLNFMGFQITGESMRRKTDKIDFSTVDTSKLDPSVQNALRESVPLIQQGLKIREILTDPTMVQNHPWLTKRDDIRFTQFSGTLGMGGFYTRNKAQSQESQSGESQTQARSFNNNTFNNSQQQMPKINNHNDLLYKAYVDTVQTTNVTLDNLKSYRDQIISKIQALSSYYPNINAQQAITALDNRIRKYSTQASPA